jgi:hypothetical protein
MTAATTPRTIELRQLGGLSNLFVETPRRERACAFASWRLRGRARRLLSMRPPCVPLCLRRRFFFVWAAGKI